MDTHNELNVIKEDDEERFKTTSLLTAARDGALASVQELIDNYPDINLNSTNKNGETAMHLAAAAGHLDIVRFLSVEKRAKTDTVDFKNGDEPIHCATRSGHFDIIKFLQQQGTSVNAQNKVGESLLHIATRYNYVDIVEFLCSVGADADLQDQAGDTALHMAAWYGAPPHLCAVLCKASSKLDIKNKEEETSLHCAATRANLPCLQVLIAHGAGINLPDKRGCTALHLACRRRHVDIALTLVQSGAQLDLPDLQGETALHPAAREGLLTVVQTMCAYGCRVDLGNKNGMSALHLAAKAGHTETVRCLLLSGVAVDLLNKDGVSAEVIAIAQGHNETADLLGRLKPEKQDISIKQLLPTNQPLKCIKVKVFGHSGAGKTSLIDTLKCGYFVGLLRKAGFVNNNNNNSNNIGTGGSAEKNAEKENGFSVEVSRLDTHVSFDTVHSEYTRGIDVRLLSVPGAGDSGQFSFWEFSGYQPYYMLYDRFIGDHNCIHIIVFNLTDSRDTQLQQIFFWLYFIKSCIQPHEPIGFAGRLPYPARVLLVGTHADKIRAENMAESSSDSPADVAGILEEVERAFIADFRVHRRVFPVDTHNVMSVEMKFLRQSLGVLKAEIVQTLPAANGFLHVTVAALPAWCKVLGAHPVVTWPSFMEYVRATVNILASEEHLREVMCQLQLMGEVVYIEAGTDDFVVLSPRWLCSTVIGRLLSREQLMNHTRRPTGCFTAEDLQQHLPDCDVEDLLFLLEALNVSTRCDIDGDVEYELPCLNFVETLTGLWDRADQRPTDCIYGGVRLTPSTVLAPFSPSSTTSSSSGLSSTLSRASRTVVDQLMWIFPRVQVALRRAFLAEQRDNIDSDLYQWYHGAKYSRGRLEALISLAPAPRPFLVSLHPSRTAGNDERSIELRFRGPRDLAAELFYFSEDVSEMILAVIEDSCPGLVVERRVLSAAKLREHCDVIPSYSAQDILLAQLRGESLVILDDSQTISGKFATNSNNSQAALRTNGENGTLKGGGGKGDEVGGRRVGDLSGVIQGEIKGVFGRSVAGVSSEDSRNGQNSVLAESLVDLVAFGSPEIHSSLHPGVDTHVSQLSLSARRLLSAVLDPPDPTGRDWCLLAVSLGLASELPVVDTLGGAPISPAAGHGGGERVLGVSKTDHCLALWSVKSDATVRILLGKLLELGREDAVEAVVPALPVYRLAPPTVAGTSGTGSEHGEEREGEEREGEEREGEPDDLEDVQEEWDGDTRRNGLEGNGGRHGNGYRNGNEMGNDADNQRYRPTSKALRSSVRLQGEDSEA